MLAVTKSLFNALLILALLTCGHFVRVAEAAIQAESTASPIQLVTQHFPPFSYIEQGQVAGPARDLIDRVCLAMQRSCKHQLLPWDRAQRIVKQGQADGMYVIGWNPERSQELYYSAPLLSTEYGFFVRGDDPLHQISPDALAGYRVAVLAASNTLNSLQALRKLQHRFEIIQVTDSETAFRLLSVGRVDSVYSNHDVGQTLIRQLQQTDLHYAVAHRRLAYYVGFNRDRVSLDWVEEFNRQLDQLHQQGQALQLLRRYGLQ